MLPCWGRSSPTASPHGSTRMVLPVALQITSSCLSPTTMPSIADRSISLTSGRLGDDADGEVFEDTSRASPSCFIIICRGIGGGGGRWRMPPLWEEVVSFLFEHLLLLQPRLNRLV